MSEILVGVTLPQFTSDPDRFVDGARRAEQAGLDSIWVFDHLWPLGGPKERSILEAWTALAYAAAETKSIRIGTLVTRSSLRQPAVLAKMAATVAELAPGRLIVGIGSGDEQSRPENEAYGIPYFGGEERLPQLRSTFEVVQKYLSGGPVTHEDSFTRIEDLPPSPRPARRPALWVGGRSDYVLEVAGALANGWNGWGGGPERFAKDAATVAEHAAGRPVELSWGGRVVLGPSDDEVGERLEARDPRRLIAGTPATVAAALSRYVEAGARHLICSFPQAWRPGLYESLAGEVRPSLHG